MGGSDKNAQHFLDLIKRARQGKFKVYIGMSAGVGKTYRMLQEAHTLHKNGIDVKLGYVETHSRKETQALVEGLPVIPRRKLFYKGKELEEMDVQGVIAARPEVVIVDELAHTNIEGSKNEKRWQDVMEILQAGINVISAVNIQHLESLNEAVKGITGVEVQERVPDQVLAQADEVVNIDLTADELITRLKEGKIYTQDKIELALRNFFKSEHILQLRELALKEVASQVLRKVETEIPQVSAHRHERILACISSNDKQAKHVIRKSARLAGYYHAKWYVLYVQTAAEAPDKIALDKQRHLIHNFMLATELGAEIIKVTADNVTQAIVEAAEQNKITTICIGKPRLSLWKILLSGGILNTLLKQLSISEIDLIIVS
jgi:two-component system, OmpR family, sensor histidine kinase KdpD